MLYRSTAARHEHGQFISTNTYICLLDIVSRCIPSRISCSSPWLFHLLLIHISPPHRSSPDRLFFCQQLISRIVALRRPALPIIPGTRPIQTSRDDNDRQRYSHYPVKPLRISHIPYVRSIHPQHAGDERERQEYDRYNRENHYSSLLTVFVVIDLTEMPFAELSCSGLESFELIDSCGKRILARLQDGILAWV